MKFKDGAAVEVCRREGDVFGSWFRARVVSSNGCAYTVQYDHFLNGDRHPVTEEVHLKAIRPIPPTQIVKNWASGDTVEVHDCHSWKVAELMKVLPSNFFVVRLLNSDQQRTCHLSNLRSQQSWQSSKWVLTRQVEVQL